MKCGGSDGLSGITANPVVGAFSDLLVSKGGTTILTEVPEMFGAETILMNRCETPELFEKTVDLINDFKNYFTSHNQTIYENPSPGNKKGGNPKGHRPQITPQTGISSNRRNRCTEPTRSGNCPRASIHT